MRQKFFIVLSFFLILTVAQLSAQQTSAPSQNLSSSSAAPAPTAAPSQTPSATTSTSDQKKKSPDQPQVLPDTPGAKGDRIHYDTKQQLQQPSTTPAPGYGQEPKRIMGWIPNFRAVSVDAKVPPPNFKEKLKVGTENSFDYSAFIFEAEDSGVSYAEQVYPEFGTGFIAYGRYYWHGFVDKAIGNYMTDTIVPTLTHEDSRYYELGRGRWYKRALYAYSRVAITPNDDGHNTFNFSEIGGKGAAAGLGALYYPTKYRTFGYVSYRWAWQVGVLDGGYNVFREFWPDVSKRVFHSKP